MNFCNLPDRLSNHVDSKVAILPVPYDGTSTWLKGADKGPDAIIDASQSLELYDIDTDCEICDIGIYTHDPVSEDTSPETMTMCVRERVFKLASDGKFPVVIGGEHSVSIGAVQALALKYPKMCVLQLDAHSDLRREYHGSEYNHACVMARVKEVCPAVQVGIRSMDISEKQYMDTKRVFFAKDIYGQSGWADKVVRLLSKDVYVTIDLDVLDPSYMPSTGTPEPGGLHWYDVMNLLRKVAEERNVVGFDVVELCPSSNRAPDFLAAKMIYQFLSYIFHCRGVQK